MPLVPARVARQSPPDFKFIFSPAASVRKSPAALRITPSWLVSSRIDRESANRSAVTENRRSDAVSNSRCRPHSAATASPWTATGADSAVGLTPDCRLRCQESIRAEGVDVSGSPARKTSHAPLLGPARNRRCCRLRRDLHVYVALRFFARSPAEPGSAITDRYRPASPHSAWQARNIDAERLQNQHGIERQNGACRQRGDHGDEYAIFVCSHYLPVAGKP